MADFVYIDGELVPTPEARVSVFDHGLLYGDGVFEGIRAYNGRVFRLDEHLRRLWASARYIMLSIPLSVEQMKAAVLQTLRANKLQDGYVRLVVTRGVGDLGLDPAKCAKSCVLIIADAIQLYDPTLYEKGLDLVVCSVRRISPDALDVAAKTLNYLNSILAKIETVRAGAQEGIMLNAQGQVAECTGDNIFIVLGQTLVTPPPHAGILKGITRDAIMALAADDGYEVQEALFNVSAILGADECFLTGTGAEIVPAVTVDGRPIGNGKPGPVTKRLRARFRELVQNEGTPIHQQPDSVVSAEAGTVQS